MPFSRSKSLSLLSIVFACGFVFLGSTCSPQAGINARVELTSNLFLGREGVTEMQFPGPVSGTIRIDLSGSFTCTPETPPGDCPQNAETSKTCPVALGPGGSGNDFAVCETELGVVLNGNVTGGSASFTATVELGKVPPGTMLVGDGWTKSGESKWTFSSGFSASSATTSTYTFGAGGVLGLPFVSYSFNSALPAFVVDTGGTKSPLYPDKNAKEGEVYGSFYPPGSRLAFEEPVGSTKKRIVGCVDKKPPPDPDADPDRWVLSETPKDETKVGPGFSIVRSDKGVDLDVSGPLDCSAHFSQHTKSKTVYILDHSSRLHIPYFWEQSFPEVDPNKAFEYPLADEGKETAFPGMFDEVLKRLRGLSANLRPRDDELDKLRETLRKAYLTSDWVEIENTISAKLSEYKSEVQYAALKSASSYYLLEYKTGEDPPIESAYRACAFAKYLPGSSIGYSSPTADLVMEFGAGIRFMLDKDFGLKGPVNLFLNTPSGNPEFPYSFAHISDPGTSATPPAPEVHMAKSGFKEFRVLCVKPRDMDTKEMSSIHVYRWTPIDRHTLRHPWDYDDQKSDWGINVVMSEYGNLWREVRRSEPLQYEISRGRGNPISSWMAENRNDSLFKFYDFLAKRMGWAHDSGYVLKAPPGGMPEVVTSLFSYLATDRVPTLLRTAAPLFESIQKISRPDQPVSIVEVYTLMAIVTYAFNSPNLQSATNPWDPETNTLLSASNNLIPGSGVNSISVADYAKHVLDNIVQSGASLEYVNLRRGALQRGLFNDSCMGIAPPNSPIASFCKFYSALSMVPILGESIGLIQFFTEQSRITPEGDFLSPWDIYSRRAMASIQAISLAANALFAVGTLYDAVALKGALGSAISARKLLGASRASALLAAVWNSETLRAAFRTSMSGGLQSFERQVSAFLKVARDEKTGSLPLSVLLREHANLARLSASAPGVFARAAKMADVATDKAAELASAKAIFKELQAREIPVSLKKWKLDTGEEIDAVLVHTIPTELYEEFLKLEARGEYSKNILHNALSMEATRQAPIPTYLCPELLGRDGNGLFIKGKASILMGGITKRHVAESTFQFDEYIFINSVGIHEATHAASSPAFAVVFANRSANPVIGPAYLNYFFDEVQTFNVEATRSLQRLIAARADEPQLSRYFIERVFLNSMKSSEMAEALNARTIENFKTLEAALFEALRFENAPGRLRVRLWIKADSEVEGGMKLVLTRMGDEPLKSVEFRYPPGTRTSETLQRLLTLDITSLNDTLVLGSLRTEILRELLTWSVNGIRISEGYQQIARKALQSKDAMQAALFKPNTFRALVNELAKEQNKILRNEVLQAEKRILDRIFQNIPDVP